MELIGSGNIVSLIVLLIIFYVIFVILERNYYNIKVKDLF